MHLTLRQLHYFVAVIDAGSMTRAADDLHVAPTALSLSIKAMEDHFDMPLLHRHSRGVVPTDVGQTLYGRARKILGLVVETERAIARQAGTATRQISLGVPPAIARMIGVDALMGVSRLMPGLSLQVSEGWTTELQRRLNRAELDVVLGYGLDHGDGIEVVNLISDPFVFAASPRLLAPGETITLAEVLATDLVFYGEKSVGWRATTEAAMAQGAVMASERQVESIDVWRELLCRGLGTTVTSVSAIAEELVRGEVAVRTLSDATIARMIGIAIRSEVRAEPWAEGLIRFLSDLVKDAHR